MHVVKPHPEGAAQLIAEGAGQRQVTLRSFENGVTEVQLARLPQTSLVLNGGGAGRHQEHFRFAAGAIPNPGFPF
ncbi:hypothetical protein ACIOZM_23450 [Pseudomonas sp. NPDC087346]|uniref:hypothetical protein n=1 Tax=Pseudomonas sp. NPDC087346 TaxID=3364438 RepID=UPI0038191CB8